MRIAKRVAFVFAAILPLMVPGQTYAQGSSPVVITAWGMHYGGQIVYRYQVQNFGSVPISKFIIGLYQPVTEDGFAELSVLPKSNDSSFWLPQQVARRPDGWGALLVFPEESETFAIEWVEAAYHRKIWPQGGKGDSAPVARVPPIFVPRRVRWIHFQSHCRKLISNT
jgi:hypothetical protein